MPNTYIDSINNNKLFAERAIYTSAGKNIDNELNAIEGNTVPLVAGDNVTLTSAANGLKVDINVIANSAIDALFN
jgi:hypothetical protein